MSVSITSKGDLFTVTTTKADGSVAKSEAFAAESALNIADMGKGLSREFSDNNIVRRRTLILSTLATIFGSTSLDSFMGKGDCTTGKLPDHFKAGVRDAEKTIAIQLVEAGHLKLPVHKFDTVGKLPEQAIQSWLSMLRDDPGYSKAKSVVSRYFCLVGSRNITESGLLIPVPVMEAHIRDVVKKTEVEDSYGSRLAAILAAINADKKATAETIGPCLHPLKEMLSVCENLMRQFAELANAARGTSGEKGLGAQEIVQGAADAIAQAQSRKDEEIRTMQESTGRVEPEKMEALAAAVNNNKPGRSKKEKVEA